MQWFLEQAMSLTFDFNKNVPHPGVRIDRIKILSDLGEVDSIIEKTRDLLKLEFANNLLLAAQYRINDANPIDYVYKVRMYKKILSNKFIKLRGRCVFRI
jgi:hypothetical protein